MRSKRLMSDDELDEVCEVREEADEVSLLRSDMMMMTDELDKGSKAGESILQRESETAIWR